MIETLLRAITNRGIWKFIWLPHISTITLRSNEPLTYDTNFPLSHDSLLIRGYDRRYLCVTCQIFDLVLHIIHGIESYLSMHNHRIERFGGTPPSKPYFVSLRIS